MAGYGYVTSSVSTADAVLKTGAGFIHWITISNIHATEASAIELEDTGTDVWGITVEALDQNIGIVHAVFDPPIRCTTGISVDITNGTIKATVGIS